MPPPPCPRHHRRHHLLPALALCLLTGGAQAALFDDFGSGSSLARNRWNATGFERRIVGGQLQLGRQTQGGRLSNSGLLPEDTSLSLRNGGTVTAIQATVTISAHDLSETCAANRQPAAVWAQVGGAFFNVRSGGAVPGQRQGDVLALLRIFRSANSPDAAGSFRVEGGAYLCASTDCNQRYPLAPPVSLGSVMQGMPLVAQVAWDRSQRAFIFTRDALGAMAINYDLPDSRPPASAWRQLGVRVDAPNCSAHAVRASVLAQFDDVGLLP